VTQPAQGTIRGKLKAEAVLHIANSAAGDGEIFDDNFYVREWHFVHGEFSAAIPLMQKAVDNCPRGMTEGNMAIFELHKLASCFPRIIVAET
jgi:hypothetical protein